MKNGSDSDFLKQVRSSHELCLSCASADVFGLICRRCPSSTGWLQDSLPYWAIVRNTDHEPRAHSVTDSADPRFDTPASGHCCKGRRRRPGELSFPEVPS